MSGYCDATKRERVIELRKSGLRYSEIEKVIGGKKSCWIKKVCDENGLGMDWYNNLIEERIIDLRREEFTQKEIAERIGVSTFIVAKIERKNNLGGWSENAKKYMWKPKGDGAQKREILKKNELEVAAEIFKWSGGKYDYAGGYINTGSPVQIVCTSCGAITTKSYNTIRNIRHRPPQPCKRCEEIKAQKEKEQKEQLRKQLKEQKETERESRKRTVKCGECGTLFVTYKSRQVYCSKDCARKAENRIASHRKDSRIAKEKRRDRNITAKKLYDRDDGICWICGGKCDLDDFTIKGGTIICGNNYPSIDHIVPVCEGGEDSWNNVRLAHRICNTKRFYQKVMPPTSADCA